jgi:hypothetical protein
MRVIKKNILPLHPLNKYRDVAQLVAHYVRDVGVGRSSRLIPTQRERECAYLGTFSSFLLFAVDKNGSPNHSFVCSVCCPIGLTV